MLRNYPSVTLTRFFFVTWVGIFNLAAVVYHLRPGQLVFQSSCFRFQILDFRFQI